MDVPNYSNRMPSPSPVTTMQSHNDFWAIKKKMDSDYISNQSVWNIYQNESAIDARLESGDIKLMGELNNASAINGRPQWFFNRTRPLCNMVSGRQRQNRKSSIVVPLENADQDTADQLTKLLLQIYKRENVYETISSAFHKGACITGLSLIHMYLDFQSDPLNGDLKFDTLDYNQIWMDPYFRKEDLSDCQFIWRRTFVSHSKAANLFPEYYEEIMALPGNPLGRGRDAKFPLMPESSGRAIANRLAYDEYYYRDYRLQKLLIDKQTGETLDVTNKENLDIEFFLDQNPQVSLIEQQIPTVKLAIQIQDKIFYNGPQPITGLDEFPMVPVFGFYNAMLPDFYSRIQGLCRSLRDPQMLLNHRIIQSADLIESQLNSGWIFKENAVIDVKHLFKTGQGRVIPLKADAQMTDLMPIVPPQIPPSFFQMQETFSKELNLVSGINEELMGSALDDKAGILSMLRQGAGLVTLQPLFDRLDNAQNQLAKIIIIAMQNNYTPGKIKTMLEGEEPADLFYNQSFGKYHCDVQEGFNTGTQKQMEMAQLMQLKELGVDIPPSALIEAATLQNKKQLTQLIQQREQSAMQMQQMQLQSEMQEAQARIKLAQARSVADEGLGYERLSRVDENKALAEERRAQAHKDDEEALFTKIKMLKEIEDLDIGHLERYVQIALALREPKEEVKP